MTCYYLAGIQIETKLELPLPLSTPSPQGAEVFVFEGSRLTPEEAPARISWNWSDLSKVTLAYPGLGIASILDGREIHLRPCGEGAEWRGLILPVFAVLMYQRGIFSLHGSTVSRNGEAIGFLGACGAGKSTMTAQLTNAGWDFLADDLLFLKNPPGHPVKAWPGFSILKLRDDSATATGKHLSRMGPLYPKADKDGFSPAAASAEQKPQLLRALFLLEESEQIEIEQLSLPEALFELVENTYGARVFEGKKPEPYLQKSAEIAKKVPIYRLKRPKDFSRTGELLRHLDNFVSTADLPLR